MGNLSVVAAPPAEGGEIVHGILHIVANHLQIVFRRLDLVSPQKGLEHGKADGDGDDGKSQHGRRRVGDDASPYGFKRKKFFHRPAPILSKIHSICVFTIYIK